MQGPPPGFVPEFEVAPPEQEHGPVSQDTQVFAPVDSPKEEDDEDIEQDVIDKIRKKTKPGLKFTNLPKDPTAPSGAPEEEVEKAIKKLKSRFKDNSSVKDVRRDLTPDGKPVLFIHTTMPKSLGEDTPDSVNGFEVRVAPLHRSLADDDVEDTDREAGDSLVAPSPNRPENGDSKGREYPPGPYMNQVSGPPPVGMELNRQTRDIPKR